MASDDFTMRASKIRWDGASLVTLEGSQHQMFDDAFIVIKVPLDQVQNVAFVSGMIPIVSNYKKIRLMRELSGRETADAVKALRELRDFMFHNGYWDKKRQKLLRNLSLVELLVDAVRTPLVGAAAIDLRHIERPEHM